MKQEMKKKTRDAKEENQEIKEKDVIERRETSTSEGRREEREHARGER